MKMPILIILLATVSMGCVTTAVPPLPPTVLAVEATMRAQAEDTASIPPTPAQAPTRTPSPALTTRPSLPPLATCPSAEELAYMTTIDRIAGELSATSNDFAHLNELAGYDVSLIVDEDWQQNVDILLQLMIAHGDEVLDLEVPSTMGSIHHDFSKMALEIQTFAVLYAKGIDDGDVVAIEAALLHMGEVHRWADAATRQMEALCGNGADGKVG